ncbi:MAG: hypothetical protein AB7S52_08925 [Sphaerochaetaceae bacterium]
MAENNGSGAGIEPEVTGAPDADGMENRETVLPADNQSNGEAILEDGKAATYSWIAQVPADLKADPRVLEILNKSPTIGDYVRATLDLDGSEGQGEGTKGNEPVKYDNFEKSLDADSDPFGVISDSLKTTLESSNVPKEVAEKVFDALSVAQNGSMRQLVDKGKDWCEAQLRKSWADQYETKRKAMSRAYIALVQSDKELASALDRTGASINPAVAELLARIGQSIEEDGSVGSNATGSKGRDPKVPVRYPD